MMQQAKRPRFGEPAEGGQGLVEFALALPILLVVICGVMEFGVIFSDQLTLADAANDAARAGAVTYGLTQSQSQANTAAANAVTGSGGDGPTLIQCPLTVGTPTYSATQITVPLSCAYQPITPLGPLVGLLHGSINTAITLHGTAAQQLEK